MPARLFIDGLSVAPLSGAVIGHYQQASRLRSDDGETRATLQLTRRVPPKLQQRAASGQR